MPLVAGEGAQQEVRYTGLYLKNKIRHEYLNTITYKREFQASAHDLILDVISLNS